MDLEQCRVSEAEPMSKYRGYGDGFLVHSGSDTPIFIHLREQLHCRFHVIHHAGLKLSRLYFCGLVPRLCSRGFGIHAFCHNFCFTLLAKHHGRAFLALGRPHMFEDW